jgi:hypothetical protein
MRTVHLVCRIIVGVVFMFSGFVKGIDPLGFGYRLEDYFLAWNAYAMMPYAFSLSVLASTLEFVLGAVVLLNIKPRVNAWFLLFVMSFFTLLTLYDTIENPVPDCGCFGDAIKLTNVQTFLKNVVLMIPTLILFANRKKARDSYSNLYGYGLAAIITGLFLWLSIYCYRHLPLIDFMDWKVGNKMYAESTLPVKYYVTYVNKTTGESKEYLLTELPYNDSVWMNEWEFVDQRIEDPNQYPGVDLQIVDADGTDVTDIIIQNPDYHFIIVSWDIQKADKDALKRLNEFARKAEADNYSVSLLTSSLTEEVEKSGGDTTLNYSYYFADDIVLKTMVRSNPGVILMKDGIVIKKWGHRDVGEYDELKAKYIQTSK